ncbi:MAG: hypothetical protein KJ047_09090 [Anaerolineae bacterium]|nr:hypothetical protein [Anaerolineae bacterium]MEB2288769.1 hypothetical protein [Anaerolineae bacterium]
MPEPVSGALRASLEAWEREVAAQWDAFVRAPGTLRRIGGQITQTLIAQQRLRSTLQASGFRAASAGEQSARLLYLLERLEQQVNELAARVEQLERRVGRDE